MPGEFVKKIRGKGSGEKFFNEIFFNRLFHNISVPIIKIEAETGQIRYKKINNEVITNSDLVKIGENLATIHGQCMTLCEIWPSKFLERYSSQEKYSGLIKDLQEGIGKVKVGWVHGDYRLRNMLKERGRIYVTDWEYGQLGFIYWDLGIFIADIRHNQFHGRLGDLSPKSFIDGYISQIPLSNKELNFATKIGGIDIIFDHIYPRINEKKPEPRSLFKDYSSKEEENLMSIDIVSKPSIRKM
jgi:hypothetical protein